MIENIIKNNKIVNKVYVFVGSIIVRIIGLFVKVDKNKILLSSGAGKFIGDSPYVIYKELVKDSFFDDYEMIWAVDDVEKFKNDGFNVVKINSLKYLIIALSSRIWITSVNIERGLHFKRNDNFYINTWHGIPLKYIGNDVSGRADYNFNDINVFLISGEYEREIYKRAFNLKSNAIYKLGLPRNIELENFEVKDKHVLLEKLQLEKLSNKRILFYAPTWRGYDYKPLNLNKLKSAVENEYHIIVKSHPLEKLEFDDEEVTDVSHISDVSSLLKISDVIISDYSSIMIDFALLKRPIFSYIPDYKKYHRERGLYVSKEELAPNVFENEDALIKGIKSLNVNQERTKTEKYLQNFVEVSSRSSTKEIINLIKKELRE
ncbi:MAG: hypothetical protein GX984_00355 [Erysipelothrix sp.]|nr:hypothetical protein [Erysipelothrix sp.]